MSTAATPSEAAFESFRSLMSSVRDALFFFIALFYLMGFTYYASLSTYLGVEMSLEDVAPLQLFAYMYDIFAKAWLEELMQILLLLVILAVIRGAFLSFDKLDSRRRAYERETSRYRRMRKTIDFWQSYGNVATLVLAVLLLGYNLATAWAAGYSGAHNWEPATVRFSATAKVDAYPAMFKDAVTANGSTFYARLFGTNPNYYRFVVSDRPPWNTHPVLIVLVKKDDIASITVRAKIDQPTFVF